ncbi:MAG: hypothetical protein ACLP2P_16280 [Desulfobaccales bacterium]
MDVPEPKNVEASLHDATTPPEIPTGMKRFYRYPFIGRLLKFCTWWLIFSGIYASTSVCPFCGQAGCPVGAASAGVVGGLFALILGKGKVLLDYIMRWFSLIRAKFTPNRSGRP